MFLFTQLPASYKSPFSVAKDHTYEELGDIMVVSSCLSLIRMNKIQMGPQREIEYTFLFLWKIRSIGQKRTADGGAVSNQGAIGFKVERELSFLDIFLREGPVKSPQLLRLSLRGRVKGRPSSWGL